MDALDRASSLILTPEELASAQASLLKSKRNLPFSVLLGGSTDLRWFKNEKGRICVKLSGFDKYPKIWHLQQQENKNKRHQAQLHNRPNHHGESDLGLYINRLLAKAIVETAREYHASTIVLPNLKNKREILESEMYAIAELKFPGQKIVQKRYVKSYRTKIHTWNYEQLTDCIKSKSAQENINIEIENQYLSSSHQERAKQLAFNVRSNSEP